MAVFVKIKRCGCACSNMTRQMPLWYVKEQNIFETLTRDHPRIEVVRVPGGSVQLIALSLLYTFRQAVRLQKAT